MMALIISNITVLALAVLLSNSLLGGPLGDFAAMAEMAKVRKLGAAVLEHNGEALLNFSNATVTPYQFASRPQIAVLSNAAKVNFGSPTAVELARFSVRSDSAAPVALAKFTFYIELDNVSLPYPVGEHYLYVSDSLSSIGELLSAPNDFVFTTSTNPIATSIDPSIVNGTIAEARFDVNNDDSRGHTGEGLTEALIIQPGVTKYFTLRGTYSGHGSIKTGIARDTMPVPPAPAQTHNVLAVDVTQNDNFIWSDLNFDIYASSSATRTSGWFNGYWVKG